MYRKIIALDHVDIVLEQDDIDYLKKRACECLEQMSKEKNPEEKKRLWLLFNSYNDLYEENRGHVGVVAVFVRTKRG